MSTKKAASPKKSNGNGLKQAIKKSISRPTVSAEWTPQVLEVISRLDTYNCLPPEEKLTDKEQDIYSNLRKEAETECSKFYSILVSTTATEKEKQKAYEAALKLPTVSQLVERAKGYNEETRSLLKAYLKATGQDKDNQHSMVSLWWLFFAGGINSEAGDMEWLLRHIVKLLFIPEVQQRLITILPRSKPEDIFDTLQRLIDFCETMQKPRNEAELDLYALEGFWRYDYTAHKGIREQYQLEMMKQQAENKFCDETYPDQAED